TTTVGTGTWSVIVTDGFGCTGTDEVNVLSASSPTALYTVTPPSPQQPGVTALFTDASQGNGAAITTWQWWFGNTIDESSEQNPAVTFLLPGQYPVQLIVTTEAGCTDTLLTTYIVAPGDVIVPNVFSPNGDGSNDFLEFSNAQYYPNTWLQVFNRWGQKIYENFHYQNNWNAPGVSEGTYFFVLRLEDQREWTGAVTLLR
ncbi:MAG TPA: gliding motility-associated C-terminal domain-containing protein, partial [Flavobacteriales bacterium]|nr:gliding motility-associated C-terminal domain-containing protein [Flavobacteriales bacterium]